MILKKIVSLHSFNFFTVLTDEWVLQLDNGYTRRRIFSMFGTFPVMGPPEKDLSYDGTRRSEIMRRKGKQNILFFLRSRTHTNSVRAIDKECMLLRRNK
jgi:hypothetical protein